MGRINRIDAELVRRNLATSRTQAAQIIKNGCVYVAKEQVLKPARQIDPAQPIVVKTSEIQKYASRGGHKIAGALAALRAEIGSEALQVADKYCLDAGASTGGFTDVLLQNGAQHVVAVDVGYGQIAWDLRQDPRVTNIERTNVRTLDPQIVQPPAQLVVGDLSFISITIVLPALRKAATADADFLLMVKPQFEVGKERLGAKGVVRDNNLRIEAVLKVCEFAIEQEKMGVKSVVASPLPGPCGNVEYFIWLTNDVKKTITKQQIEQKVTKVVLEGPQPQEGL